jgi:hypothetical protein
MELGWKSKTNKMKSMGWIDLTSLKMLAVSLWLTLYAVILPEELIGWLAVIASISTIARNIYVSYNDKKRRHDRINEEDNQAGHS